MAEGQCDLRDVQTSDFFAEATLTFEMKEKFPSLKKSQKAQLIQNDLKVVENKV